MGKLPGRLKQSLTEDEAKVESKFNRCPKGHTIPHRTNRGICTPMRCAGSTPGKREATSTEKRPKPDLPKATFTDIAEATAPDDLTERKIAEAYSRHQARMKFLKVPKFKSEEEATAWIEATKKEIAVYGIADVKYSLMLGDAQERERARKEGLAMAGHGAKDSAGNGDRPLIIIQGMGGSQSELPWVRRIDKDGKELPAGQAINVKAEK